MEIGNIFGFINIIFLLLFLAFILLAPIYALGKFLIGFSKSNNIIKKFFNNFFIYSIYVFLGILSSLICIIGNKSNVKAGEPLTIHSGFDSTTYQSFSSENTISILILTLLGIFAFFILKFFSKKLSPILYVLFSSLLILNIVFTIIYTIQVLGYLDGDFLDGNFYILGMLYCFITLSFFYLDELKNSLNLYIESELKNDRVYKNKLLFTLKKFTLSFKNMAFTWAIFIFPLALIIQFICILFGQTPTSFIDAFLNTSGYNFSTIPAPDPIILEYDGHYLCTVSVKGHKKLVKPLRYGIRHGHKIMVNRQLLIANAFENVLEEYTPKLHKIIRNFYDKYGYPLSKHINTKISADITYILMKPLEWIFLFVLYTVDNHPEDRINIQYSELRK